MNHHVVWIARDNKDVYTLAKYGYCYTFPIVIILRGNQSFLKKMNLTGDIWIIKRGKTFTMTKPLIYQNLTIVIFNIQ